MEESQSDICHYSSYFSSPQGGWSRTAAKYDTKRPLRYVRSGLYHLYGLFDGFSAVLTVLCSVVTEKLFAVRASVEQEVRNKASTGHHSAHHKQGFIGHGTQHNSNTQQHKDCAYFLSGFGFHGIHLLLFVHCISFPKVLSRIWPRFSVHSQSHYS